MAFVDTKIATSLLKVERVGIAGAIAIPLLVAIALLALFPVTAPALGQTKTGGEKYDPYALTPAQKVTVDKIAKSPMDVTALKAPTGAQGQEELQGGVPAVVLPLADGKRITLVQTLTTLKRNGGFTWRGETEETGERATLMLWHDGRVSGYFAYHGRVFIVNHEGGDIQAIPETDPSKLPPDHAPGTPDTSADPARRDNPPEPTVAPFPEVERQTLEAKKITIDLMLLYTRKARNNYILDPADLMAHAVETANQTFRHSGIGNVSLRLVHSQEIDYDEAGAEQFDHLYRMVDGLGPFKDVKKIRNEKRADVVGLIVDSPSGCGLSTRVGADADEAFFVVHHACAATTYSIAHEIGHIIGTRHDRVVDTNNVPFAYGHGYINGTKWRDIMSYKEGCDGCPRIPYWSNPRIMYKGEPTGTAATDNARVILEQAERVSKFR